MNSYNKFVMDIKITKKMNTFTEIIISVMTRLSISGFPNVRRKWSTD